VLRRFQTTRRALCILCLASAVPLTADAQGLFGTVSDSAGGPIAGAEVTVLTDSLTVRTDAQGRFGFPSLRAGTHTFRVRAIGYASTQERVIVPPGGQANVRIVLREVRPLLDSVRATVTVHQCPSTSLMGFACRRDAGSTGDFRNVEDLARIKPKQLYDVFDGLPGIRKVPGQGPDGLLEWKPGVRPSRCLVELENGRPPTLPFRLWTIKDIIAVEYYDAYNKIPMGYRTFVGDCDLIIYWLRGAPLIGR
jgi:hypothetical protein